MKHLCTTLLTCVPHKQKFDNLLQAYTLNQFNVALPITNQTYILHGRCSKGEVEWESRSAKHKAGFEGEETAPSDLLHASSFPISFPFECHTGYQTYGTS